MRVLLRSLLARKLRLFLTSLAVLLGVAFMAGTLVLTDTIGRTFDRLFADVYAGTDAFVRARASFETDLDVQRGRVPESLVAVIRGIDGVAAVEGNVESYAQIRGRDGKPVGNPAQGAPTFGRNWGTVPALNPFRIVDGRAPQADDEVVVDRGTAKVGKLAVGDVTTVVTQGPPRQVRVVGIATFGDVDSPGGASNVLFHTPTAQRLLARPGQFDAISVVAADGVSQRELRERIARALPADVEVLTGAEITEENQSALAEALVFFNVFMLTFAVIALLVGAFIIHNTFSILVAQRGREVALLRAIGAGRRQVLATVLVEASLVGVVASALGLLAGIAVAAGLKALLAGFGIDIPAGGVVFRGRTVVLSFTVGILVSVLSAVFPARRAARMSPLAALRDLATEAPTRSRRRTAVGLGILGSGGALLFNGLSGGIGNALASVGVGAVVTFLGVAVLGPVLARPVSRALGAPLPRLRGVPGRLARENAMRNPRRTAATATALTVGVGLVGFITILASSAKASLGDTIDRSFGGDFVVTSGTFGFGGLSPDLAQRLAALPEVEAVSGWRLGQINVAGKNAPVSAVDADTFAEIFDIGVVAGDLRRLDATGLALSEDTARERGVAVGDPLTVRFVTTGDKQFTVRAIYQRGEIMGRYVLDLAAWEANSSEQFDFQVLVEVRDSTDPAAARRAVEETAKAYPTAKVLDQTQFKKQQEAQVNQLLGLIYVLLAFACLIAVFGIGNTLALSIFERTRELGLLRAVGMTREQLRSAIRWESVITALLGTALGLAVGLFFGWALVTALADEGITRFVIPGGQLAVITVVAALAGVLAAVLPARRAARLDVLAAIATT